MGKKAVYNNQYVGVYITGSDFDELLEKGYAYVSINIGDRLIYPGVAYVALDLHAIQVFRQAVKAERAAILQVQTEALKNAPPKRGPGRPRKEVSGAES